MFLVFAVISTYIIVISVGVLLHCSINQSLMPTKIIDSKHKHWEKKEIVEPPIKESKSSSYYLGRDFETKYGSTGKSVLQICKEDKGPRETNIVAEFTDPESGETFTQRSCGYRPTLIGNLEKLLKSGTPDEIDDFNSGRLSYVEEKGKEALTIMDNSSDIEKGSRQVESLRQGFKEIATHKSPKLQWQKEFDEV